MVKSCITSSSILYGISKYWIMNYMYECDNGSRAMPST